MGSIFKPFCSFNKRRELYSHNVRENLLTNQPARASRSKRIFYGIIAVVAVFAIFIGYKIYYHIQAQNVPEVMIVAAVRANFPDFCTNGQIVTEPILHDRPILATDFDAQWGIKCDSWAKGPMAFYGDATVVDVDRCMTIPPSMGTVGQYYFQFEAINKTNGQKLAFCP